MDVGAPGMWQLTRITVKPILAFFSKFPDFVFLSHLQNLPKGDFPCSCKLEIYVPYVDFSQLSWILSCGCLFFLQAEVCETEDVGETALWWDS